MLTCENALEALAARHDGEPAHPELDRHLAGCAACRAAQDELAGVDRFLTSEPLLPADAGLTARLRARIADEANLPRAQAPRPWAGAVASLAAACAVVALLMAMREDPTRVQVAQVASPSPSIRAKPPRPPVEPGRVAAALRSELARLDREIADTRNNLTAYQAVAKREAKEQHERMMARSFESWK